MDFYEECKRDALIGAINNQNFAASEASSARIALRAGLIAKAVELQVASAYSYRMARKHMERAANVE